MNDVTVTAEQAKREQRRAELASTDFTANAQGGALMNPKNGKELMDMANLVAGSGSMVRDIYRNNPGDCAALIMICQPYGFNPFMVSWKTYKASKNADAPIAFEGQLVNAMVNRSAPVKGRLRYEYDGEGPTRRVTVTGIDRETGDPITYTSPPMSQIPVKNSPLWKADPDQQLAYFGARSWARRHFPELLLGVYTREEIEEAPGIRDVTPKTGGFTARAQAARQPEPTPEYEPPEGQPDDAIDGKVLDEANVTVGRWTFSQIELHSEPTPMDDGWGDGMEAAKDGITLEGCPEDDRDRALAWAGGWLEATEKDRSDA